MKIYEIVEYIVKNFPESILGLSKLPNNYKEDYNDQYYTEQCLKFFDNELLGLCGCGSPEDTDNVIMKILEIINTYHEEGTKLSFDEAWNNKENAINNLLGVFINNDDNNNYYGLIQFMLYILDDKGILEHGSSICGAWLTDLGKMYLKVLKKSYYYNNKKELE